MTIRARRTTAHRHAAALLVGAVVLAAGCAPAPEGSPTATPSSSTSSGPAGNGPASTAPTSAPEAPAGPRVEVTVTGRTVQPAPSQVDLAAGETLTVVVTADVDTTIHAHGFEVEQPVPANTPTTVALTGSAPGLYEVELHHPDLLLLQVAVR